MGKRILALFLFSELINLFGCAAMGVVETSNPEIKLQDARYLFSKYDRPFPAERLIREAIEIYKEKNDQIGLANAYNMYGWFFQSPSIGGWASVNYKKHGFLDKSADFNSRYEKSIEYFEKARIIQIEKSAFDGLTNTYLGMGHTYGIMNSMTAACGAYESSLESYYRNIQVNPDAQVNVQDGYENPVDFIVTVQKQAGCIE